MSVPAKEEDVSWGRERRRGGGGGEAEAGGKEVLNGVWIPEREMCWKSGAGSFGLDADASA